MVLGYTESYYSGELFDFLEQFVHGAPAYRMLTALHIMH